MREHPNFKPWLCLTTTYSAASLFHEANGQRICFDIQTTARTSLLEFFDRNSQSCNLRTDGSTVCQCYYRHSESPGGDGFQQPIQHSFGTARVQASNYMTDVNWLKASGW